MFKKTIFLILALGLIAALMAACAAAPASASTTQNGSSQTNNGQGGNANNRGGFDNQDPASMPVESKLGIGILKLENTSLAVTAQQANDLLPLWQGLKSMETSNNASAEEITALLGQIKDTLTPQQVDAIQKMTWQQSDLQALLQQYGVQFGGGGQRGTPDPTRIAQFRANNGGGFGGGFGGGPGGFGGAPGGGASTTGNATRTPSPQQLNRRAIGFNSIFIDPVITLLTTRSKS
jgi:ABC-type glycerol-3-phosphate transport system substrate-binding protein